MASFESELRDAMVAEAARLGGRDVEVVRLKKHPAVRFYVAGRRVTVSMVGSCTGWSTMESYIGSLRRKVQAAYEGRLHYGA